MTEHFSQILQKRATRRGLLKGGALTLAASSLPFAFSGAAKAKNAGFSPINAATSQTHQLAEGYRAQVLLRWGDAILPDAPAFNPLAQSAKAQAQQFGYNNDFVAYFPTGSFEGVLCVNHEFTMPELMFASGRSAESLSDEEQRIEMAAVGCSIIAIECVNRQWQTVLGTHSRRITATTPMQLTGPAAGHTRLQTSADASGKNVLGTFANCAGGQTPWGTYLSCEENIDDYFWLGDYAGDQLAAHKAFGIGHKPYHRWDKVDARFDVGKEPNEPNRFGWVVEIDPFDPQSTPKKRTALGRFKHESATLITNEDGRLVVYSGDDEHFQFIYKYVSTERYIQGGANDHLLDDGTLYAARFDDEGALHWLPLRYGEAPLNETGGFTSQGDVLIDTRRAATLMGATPMDRPEGIAIHPQTGGVYIAMTKNPARQKTDSVNRHAPNPYGYIVQMTPPAGDHAAGRFGWEMYLEGGKDSLACPDNLAFDAQGQLWVATDGQQKAIGKADALYACDDKGNAKRFFQAPIGAEVTGPCFTPDGKTLFLAIQHPAESSHYNAPSTRWPDFDEALPPRPSIMAIRKEVDGVIGS